MRTSFRTLIAATLPLLLIFSCKEKTAVPDEKFIPVIPFLQSQVRSVDTSLYSIRQYVYVDSLRTDTFYIHRDQFKALASDFLSLPDISSKEYAGRYKETEQYDEMLNRLLVTYTPLDPDKEEIQDQQVLISKEGDRIISIIINAVKSNRDSSVQKRLLWQGDESFQVVTIRQLAGQPETTRTFKVTWNEDPNE